MEQRPWTHRATETSQAAIRAWRQARQKSTVHKGWPGGWSGEQAPQGCLCSGDKPRSSQPYVKLCVLPGYRLVLAQSQCRHLGPALLAASTCPTALQGEEKGVQRGLSPRQEKERRAKPVKSLSENGTIPGCPWGGHSAFCFSWTSPLLSSASQAPCPPHALLSLTHSSLLQQFLFSILGGVLSAIHPPAWGPHTLPLPWALSFGLEMSTWGRGPACSAGGGGCVLGRRQHERLPAEGRPWAKQRAPDGEGGCVGSEPTALLGSGRG